MKVFEIVSLNCGAVMVNHRERSGQEVCCGVVSDRLHALQVVEQNQG